MRRFRNYEGPRIAEEVTVARNVLVLKGKEIVYGLFKKGDLYYVSVRYSEEISSALIGDSFFDAVIIYEKLVKNLVTPCTLRYVIDDYFLEKQNA